MEINELLERIKNIHTMVEAHEIIKDILSLREAKAEELSTNVGLYSQTFISEKENGYQMTVTEAEHRAKANFGGLIEKLREDLQTLSFMYQWAMKLNDDMMRTGQISQS